jgi:hypothetical protein
LAQIPATNKPAHAPNEKQITNPGITIAMTSTLTIIRYVKRLSDLIDRKIDVDRMLRVKHYDGVIAHPTEIHQPEACQGADV